jgi:thiol-disulfide isomerase/thioredoxin
MLGVIPFFSHKIYYITLFSFIGYFYLTSFFLRVFNKKLSETFIVLLIFTSILLLQAFTIYTWFVWDTYGLPAVMTHCLGVISAYFYYKSKTPKNTIIFTLSSCFVVFMFFQGWDYWLHKINFGTFTGQVSYTLPAKFEAFDENKNFFTEQDFNNKIVVLDFWFSRCGACFDKFPKVQELYNKYQNDSSVLVIAVNRPIEEDKKKSAFQIIKEDGYSFPVVVVADEEMPEKLGVNKYPTTFVIDQNGTIVFKGRIENAFDVVANLKNK